MKNVNELSGVVHKLVRIKMKQKNGVHKMTKKKVECQWAKINYEEIHSAWIRRGSVI